MPDDAQGAPPLVTEDACKPLAKAAAAGDRKAFAIALAALTGGAIAGPVGSAAAGGLVEGLWQRITTGNSPEVQAELAALNEEAKEARFLRLIRDAILEDERFDQVAGALIELDENAERRHQELLTAVGGRKRSSQEPAFEGPGHIPAQAVDRFVDFEEAMAELTRCLTRVDTQAVCVVAQGIGGVGKTSLARHFVAMEARQRFPDGALWLDATNLGQEILLAAASLDHDGELDDPTVSEAHAWLCCALERRAVLVVVDNVQRGQALAEIPMMRGRSRTLVTSRNTQLHDDLRPYGATEKLEVKVWPVELCRDQLRSLVSRAHIGTDEELEELAAFVGGLPLAIRLLARHFERSRTLTASRLLERLKAAPLAFLDKHGTDADRGVAATFMFTWQEALSTGERAALQAMGSCARATRTDIVADVAEMTSPEAEEALDSLANWSLVSFEDGAEAPWSVHDVVRIFVRAQDGQAHADARHEAWVEYHAAQYADPSAHVGFGTGVDEGLWAVRRALSEGRVERASILLYPVWDYLERVGRLGVAAVGAEELLMVVEAGSATEATWLGNLGIIYKTRGELDKAEEHQQRSLAIHTELGNKQGMASALGNLGIIYRTQGELDKAEEHHQRSLAIETELGSKQGMASVFGNLGFLYKSQEKTDLAREHLSKSLELLQQMGLPEDHPTLTKIQASLDELR